LACKECSPRGGVELKGLETRLIPSLYGREGGITRRCAPRPFGAARTGAYGAETISPPSRD